MFKYLFEKEQHFEFKGHWACYSLIVDCQYEVILADQFPPLDMFGYSLHETEAHPVYPMLACIVYRWAVRTFLEWLYTYKPPQFHFSTGKEERRRSLYTRFALMAENHGYTCYASTDDHFYFIRNQAANTYA